MPKTALITGAAKRVGRSIALHLAQNGYDILFTYKNSQTEAADLVQQIQSLGQQAKAIQADFHNPQSAVDVLVDTFSVGTPTENKNSPPQNKPTPVPSTSSSTEHPSAPNTLLQNKPTPPASSLQPPASFFPSLDLLIHNASHFEPDDPSRLLDQSRKMMALHFETPLLLVKAFKDLLQKSRGHVIHIADILAEKPWHTHSIYCASKAALVNLIKSQSRELAPHVTVNGIAPGVVEWPTDFPEDQKQKYLQKVPLGHPGSPEDVAKLVLFLATDAAYITGQIIKLDGGRSIA